MNLGEMCANCGLTVTEDLRTVSGRGKKAQYADPCLGILPGIKYGCCGHGDGFGYLFFQNGRILRFEEPIEVEVKLVSRVHKFNEGTTMGDKQV